MFYHRKNMGVYKPHAWAKFDHMGLIVPHNIAAYLISLLWILWFQRRRLFSCFSYYKPIEDPRGMVGRINKGNYHPLLYTKYSIDLVVSERKIFMAFLL